MTNNGKSKETRSTKSHRLGCECEICRLKLPFALPKQLIDQYAEGNLVIFAGAGISTENADVLSDTLYERLSWAYDNKDYRLDFPQLMQKIESLPDGRLKLLSEIQERIEYIRSFPELYREATRFHRALATLWKIDTIITTNWDDFFERECNAVPFVNGEDMAFWDAAKRRVLKIHGSYQNYGSIVATSTDYKKARKGLTKGVLGAQLKVHLATKSVIFVGYSLRDHDFLDLYKIVSKELGSLKRQAYVVTPVASVEDEKRFFKIGLKLIRTDGEFFLNELKQTVVDSLSMLPDETYDHLEEILSDMRDAHSHFCSAVNFEKNPAALYCAYYQDGLIHGLERITNMRTSGQYSDIYRNQFKIMGYFDRRKGRLSQKRYSDVAYIDGYIEALSLVAGSEPDGEMEYPTPFYAMGYAKQIATWGSVQKLNEETTKFS